MLGRAFKFVTTPDLDFGGRDGAKVWLGRGVLKSGTTERCLFFSLLVVDDGKMGEAGGARSDVKPSSRRVQIFNIGMIDSMRQERITDNLAEMQIRGNGRTKEWRHLENRRGGMLLLEDFLPLMHIERNDMI